MPRPIREAGSHASLMGQTCGRVGIVILNWKRPRDTITCVESLRKQTYRSLDIVVVNNGAPNDELTAATEALNAKLIQNRGNLGFAGGNNVGIGYALRSGADYVMLLNDDTDVDADMVRHLVEVAESDPRIGILGPKIYYAGHGRSNVIWSAGGAIDAQGRPRHLSLDETDPGLPESVRDVDYVTGCALLARREVIDSVGALDERFFAYFEEAEWCKRARRAGFRVVYVPSARMWHKLEPGDRAQSPLYQYLMARNRLLYLQCSNARSPVILGAALEMLRTALNWALRARYRAMRPMAPVLIRAVFDFARGRLGPPPPKFLAFRATGALDGGRTTTDTLARSCPPGTQDEDSGISD